MSYRYNCLQVALEKEMSEDEVERIKNAIQMIRGVLRAEAVVADIERWSIRAQVRMDMVNKLYAALHE